MCLLSVLKKGVPADEKHLRNGLEINSEGAGWALITDDGILSGKGLNGSFELDSFLKYRSELGRVPGVFHTRAATAGIISADECHPHAIGGDPQKLLFLNGTLPAQLWMPWRDGSDAAQFAANWLPSYERICHDLPPADVLGQIIGPGNRMVIVTPDGLTIGNEDQFFVAPDGVLHSNADYLGEGQGWDEREVDGELYRWNLYQPGQCTRCNLLGHDDRACGNDRAEFPPRWRNETERRQKLGQPS
jgi:hypothetical protein